MQTSDVDVFNAIQFLECDPEIVGPPPQDVAIVVESSSSHYRIVEDGRMVKGVLGVRAVLEYLHVHLFRRSIEERPLAALLHAACLRRGGRRLLLAGSKSAGKTTFALRLMQSSFELEGDEHVLIHNTGVVARPRACRVKASALSVLPDMASIIVGAPSYVDDTNGTIFNVDPRMLGATWRVEQGQVDVVIALQPNHGGFSSIRPLSPSSMAQVLMSEIGLRETDRGSAVGAIAALASRARAFDLSLGEHAGALHCVELAMNV